MAACGLFPQRMVAQHRADLTGRYQLMGGYKKPWWLWGSIRTRTRWRRAR